ncbi:hypothetical protein JB92DRAFT_2934751 [Gautieria morchelliformis]|nr:hypothetical protein JB92DRAFT_2934751 [Gautieria morchelliformis]
MLRRQIRERRQYIYHKPTPLEAQERQTYERKQKLKEALASGKHLPTELRKEAKSLEKDLAFDEGQAEPTTHLDDEYAQAGTLDPKIVITTSRDPSSRLLQFAKERRLVFPNSHQLATACRANDHRGTPDALIVSHFPHGYIHDIAACIWRVDPFRTISTFNISRLGNRKEGAKRVMTFANKTISSHSGLHHVFVDLIGPRFDMNQYEIRQETIEQTEADREWVLSSTLHTGRRQL